GSPTSSLPDGGASRALCVGAELHCGDVKSPLPTTDGQILVPSSSTLTSRAEVTGTPDRILHQSSDVKLNFGLHRICRGMPS
uniref:Uncharacterized protein n=1 Tax=Gasterosteus aculeatus TaxID=69293 RepID=G3NER8_GASAC